AAIPRPDQERAHRGINGSRANGAHRRGDRVQDRPTRDSPYIGVPVERGPDDGLTVGSDRDCLHPRVRNPLREEAVAASAQIDDSDAPARGDEIGTVDRYRESLAVVAGGGLASKGEAPHEVARAAVPQQRVALLRRGHQRAVRGELHPYPLLPRAKRILP